MPTRLKYARYADDHLLGFIGPKVEAEAIKDQLARFLRDELALELNPEKALITHGRTTAARYLGYEIIIQHCNDKLTDGRRLVNGVVALRVPLDVIKAKCAPYRPCKTWTTLTSSRPAAPNTRTSSTTTCWPTTYGDSTCSSGTQKRRC